MSELVSERLRGVLKHDPETLNQIRAMERLTASKTIYAAGNGKFPRWSADRWLTVTTLFLAAVSVAGGIWFASSEWYGVKRDVEAVKADTTTLKKDVQQVQENQAATTLKVDTLNFKVDTIERADEWYRRNSPRGPAFSPGAPTAGSGS